MALPTNGACRTDDGSMADSHDHDRRPGVSNRNKAERVARAEAICRACSALAVCAEWASHSRWMNVTIAAWTAPSHTPEFPPWAVLRCTRCNTEMDKTSRTADRCLRCTRVIKQENQKRWDAYVVGNTDDLDL